jgi:hypothetical protein
MLKNEDNIQNIKENKIKEFYPLIIHNSNGYCVYLPEWRISGTGNSLDEAYRKFEQNFKAIEEHAEMFGLATLTPEPYPQLKRSVILQDLALFYIKVASSALIVILSIVLLMPNISAAVRNSLKEMLPKEIIPIEMKDPRYWAHQFPEQMNNRLDRLTPEEEEKMRTEWSKLLSRTVPVISPTVICSSQKK